MLVAMLLVLGARSSWKISLSCIYAKKINDRVTERKLSALKVPLCVAIAHEQFSVSKCLSRARNCGICSGIKSSSKHLCIDFS